MGGLPRHFLLRSVLGIVVRFSCGNPPVMTRPRESVFRIPAAVARQHLVAEVQRESGPSKLYFLKNHAAAAAVATPSPLHVSPHLCSVLLPPSIMCRLALTGSASWPVAGTCTPDSAGLSLTRSRDTPGTAPGCTTPSWPHSQICRCSTPTSSLAQSNPAHPIPPYVTSAAIW